MTTPSPLPADEDARESDSFASMLEGFADDLEGPNWRHMAKALRAGADALRRSVVSTPSEPVAYAIYGRVTGSLKYVEVLDEEEVAERAEFYDVVPLYRSTPPTITDEMVERAEFILRGGDNPWIEFEDGVVRAALRAALGGEA